MTTMYQVRVQSVSKNRLTCRVTDVYGQDGQLVSSRTLALHFLWEPWYYLNTGIPVPGYLCGLSVERATEVAQTAPIRSELAEQDIGDENWGRANVRRFISCVGAVDHYHCDERWYY